MIGKVWKQAPVEHISLIKVFPKESSLTLPMKPAVLPRAASPAIVLAADPPEVSNADLLIKYNCSACKREWILIFL